jgi:hypothetical protein
LRRLSFSTRQQTKKTSSTSKLELHKHPTH